MTPGSPPPAPGQRVYIPVVDRYGVVVEPPPGYSDHDSKNRRWTWVMLDGPPSRPVPYYDDQWQGAQ